MDFNIVQLPQQQLVKMVAGLVLLLLLAASVSGAHGLLLTPIDGAVVDCDDPFYISCSRVKNGSDFAFKKNPADQLKKDNLISLV